MTLTRILLLSALPARVVSTRRLGRQLVVIVLLAMRMQTAIQPLHARSALSASMQQQRRLSAQTVLLDMRMLTVIQLQSASSVRRVRMRRRWPPHVPTVMRASTMTMHRVVAAL
jgi:hypothetical protein